MSEDTVLVDFVAEAERIRARAAESGRVAPEEPAEADNTADARRLALGVPRRVHDALGAAEATRPQEAVRSWLATRTPASWCLTLSGPKGCGKSVAAGYALRSLSGERGDVPRVWDADTGKEKRLRCWWTAAELAGVGVYSGELEALCKYQGALVLDDLGSEYADTKGFFSQLLDRLIDARYREYAPTVITTNLASKAFLARYGERVVDRMREGGTFCEFGGAASMRVRGS